MNKYLKSLQESERCPHFFGNVSRKTRFLSPWESFDPNPSNPSSDPVICQNLFGILLSFLNFLSQRAPVTVLKCWVQYTRNHRWPVDFCSEKGITATVKMTKLFVSSLLFLVVLSPCFRPCEPCGFVSDSRGARDALTLDMWEAGHCKMEMGFSDVICYFFTGTDIVQSWNTIDVHRKLSCFLK